jgi:UDPglucose 6-dehydrogenase
MNILIIGTGYVGLATGIALALKGKNVLFVDKNKDKIKQLMSGKLFFYEPELQSALEKALSNKGVRFSDTLDEINEKIDLIFICVGTPVLKSGKTNMENIKQAIYNIKKYFNYDIVIAVKSTINPDDFQFIKNELKSNNFHIVINPEFLREGNALNDALNPSRIVIGAEDNYAKNLLNEIYKDFNAPKIFTDPISAILIKYASNAFLATKISFINEIANLSDKLGGNIDDIALGIGLDPRIGKDFLKAGIGFGGSCLPKDTKNLVSFSKRAGANISIVEKAYKVNEVQYLVAIEKLKEVLGNLEGKTVSVFGLAFKGGTDDIRESISIKIIRELQKEGSIVKAHDYIAHKKAKTILKEIYLSDDVYSVAKDTDALLITTDWKEYKNIDWAKIRNLMRGNLIIDGRNILDKELLKRSGFIYKGIGRK